MYQVSKMRSVSLALALVVGWLWFFNILLVAGDIGTATSYDPPYLRMSIDAFLIDICNMFIWEIKRVWGSTIN